MKRFAAMLAVSVLMVLWIASGDRMSAGQRTDGLYYEVTGIHPDAVLMRINGEDISAEEYLYWLAYDCEYLTSYVPNLDFSAEVSNGMTYGSYAKADAVETVKLYALLRQWAKQYNVSLTEEDEARLQQQRQQYVTYYGGEEGYQQQLQLLGISEDTFDSINRMYLLYARIHDLYTADGSAMHPTQEATDEGWYVAIGQTLDEGSVLDEMFTENVTQARSELTVEYNQGLYDKLDAGDFYSRLTARQSELSSQFSSGSADPGTGSSTDSDNSGEKDGGSTGSGD